MNTLINRVSLNEYKARRLAFACVLFLFVYECYVVRVDYAGYFAYLVDSEHTFFSLITLACLFISFYAFYKLTYFALLASWPFRIICFVIFAFSVLVEDSYQKALGRFTITPDIQTAIATTAEQQSAALSMYLNYTAAIPCLFLLFCFIFTRSDKPLGIRQFIPLNLLFVACFAIFPVLIDQPFPTVATAAFYRTGTDFLINGPITSGKWGSNVTGITVARRQVAKPALPAEYLPDKNIIVIVDESVRGDHFSLNGYGRETTPLLDDLAAKGLLHNWGIAAAASTGSRFTYSALTTGLTPDDFPDTSDIKATTFPTIFQYAKAMNYKTHFFDGQMVGYWGDNAEDKKYMDSWSGVIDVSDGRSFEPYDLDNQIAKKVRKIIYGSKGNFIFIFKHGSHIPYQSNFPKDQEIWQPSYATTNKYAIPSNEQLESVRNAYDNSIRYNVNSFFDELIDDYTNIPNNTVILYTGDHGQSLFVNGRASHGGKTREEATVPLFVIGMLSKIDTGYRASHANIFPTILDLISYPEEFREKRGFPSLLKTSSKESRPRFFNPDLGTKMPFD
ncbi:MAG TPA: sulfatase-like hydrolase/transferase [Pyrinomonadaceae bacterium]|nr:sulfatase-like hydrolase/transferase [Pyrinomonadaceae bacterium]